MPNRYFKKTELKGYFYISWSKDCKHTIYKVVWATGLWDMVSKCSRDFKFQKKNLTDLLTVDECLAKKNLLQAILKMIPSISSTPFIGFNDLDISKCYYCTV